MRNEGRDRIKGKRMRFLARRVGDPSCGRENSLSSTINHSVRETLGQQPAGALRSKDGMTVAQGEILKGIGMSVSAIAKTATMVRRVHYLKIG
jgi:hypothetical protein